jgi:DNA-binding IclR family transcriptional regulator
MLAGFPMTLREAARFWGLDVATCSRVLSELSRVGVVLRDGDHRYCGVGP